MLRYVALVVLSAAMALTAGSSTASAQAVERSGNVFHRAVCPGPVAARMMRCHSHVVTDRNGNIIQNAATPGRTPAGFGAATLENTYGINPANGSSATIVAIVDAFGYTDAEQDMGTYRKTMGLSVCTSKNGCFAKFNQTGGQTSYPKENVGWAQETALDLDMVSAMCPKCKIYLVEANSNSNSDLDVAVNTAASLGAHVISNSYGGSESGSQGDEPSYNHAGVAVTASSGDSGYGVQFPASSPHVIAVGGTSLYLSGGRSEVAWSGTGSGCSAIYAKPAWQHDPLCTMRMEADVSAVADPATGVAVYAPTSFNARRESAAWLVFGGTSVAAPLVGGVYGNNGGSVNYGSNPYAYAGTSALYDVTSGSNGSCGGTYFCTAGPGYDGPTGLGTPIGNSAF